MDDLFEIRILHEVKAALQACADDIDALPPSDTGSVYVNIEHTAFRHGHDHAASDDKEVGGILIGDACAHGDHIIVNITAVIRGDMRDSSAVHVTFKAEDWSKMLRLQEQHFPDKQIVGWYHSHPNMPVFFSSYDLAIHRDFFNSPWFVGLVYNGQQQLMTLFTWQNGDPRPTRNIWLHHAHVRLTPDYRHYRYAFAPHFTLPKARTSHRHNLIQRVVKRRRASALVARPRRVRNA